MPDNLTYNPTISKLYSYYNLTPGQEILGITLSPDLCVTGPKCLDITPTMLIKMVGTSGGGGSGSDTDSDTDTGTDSGTRPDTGSDEDEDGTPQGNDEPCSSNADTLASSYIIANEGWKNSCYRDTEGNLTIGVGHKIKVRDSVSCGLPISDDQVQNLFDQDYAKARSQAEASARRHGVDWDSLSPERQAVLTDMAFNMGAQGGEGLDGFQDMWTAIDQAQSTSGPRSQIYWNMAGDEITDSRYGGQVSSRSNRNASVMRTNDRSMLNRQINTSQEARNNCR